MLGRLDGSHLQPLGQLAVSNDGQLADWVLDAPRIAVGAPTSFELTAIAV